MNISSTIQNLSYVHPNAIIGENVVIDPFTTIHENVEIGEGTWIGSSAVSYTHLRAHETS